jgi:hypothetical protein
MIQKLDGDQGSFNDGIWVVSDTHSQGVVLKLVPHERKHPAQPTDAERYQALQNLCPKIAMEFAFSFPVKIFHLKDACSTICKDLIVMRKAPGFQITHHLFHKFHGESIPALLNIFETFGCFMSTIHRVYRGMQHGDCQPSNVFYDERTGLFTLIDVADLGYGPYFAEGGENDVEHFIDGLKTLSQWYGEDVISECERHFRAGYSKEAERHGSSQE